MRRPIALLLALGLLAIPSPALAQSAGDEQYADPFGEVEEPNGTQEEPAPAPEPAPVPEPAPAAEAAPAAEEAVAAQESGATETLPATGLPAGILAGSGALLIAGGAALRRRLS